MSSVDTVPCHSESADNGKRRKNCTHVYFQSTASIQLPECVQLLFQQPCGHHCFSFFCRGTSTTAFPCFSTKNFSLIKVRKRMRYIVHCNDVVLTPRLCIHASLFDYRTRISNPRHGMLQIKLFFMQTCCLPNSLG